MRHGKYTHKTHKIRNKTRNADFVKSKEKSDKLFRVSTYITTPFMIK